jgi:hypothetical protein
MHTNAYTYYILDVKHNTLDEIIVGTPIKADGTLFGGVVGPPAPWVVNGLIASDLHLLSHL